MLTDVLFKYIPYWPVFVILMAVSMFGAWFYLRITPRMFEANASIMVKDEQKGVEPTNNASERAMRLFVLIRKITNGTVAPKEKSPWLA